VNPYTAHSEDGEKLNSKYAVEACPAMNASKQVWRHRPSAGFEGPGGGSTIRLTSPSTK